MIRPSQTALVLSACLALPQGFSQTPPQLIVYPAKGQTADKQKQDETECGTWAVQTTGIDPAKPAAPPAQAAAAPAAQAPPKGARVKGAARGAAAGAVVGEVANNDADEGAAVGAAVGAVAAGRQSRKQQAASQQQAAEAQKKAEADAAAAKAAQTDSYNKARAACLEGRGYTVK
jgi:hypothetical protein